MRDIQGLLLSSELGEMAADVARLFDDLDRALRPSRPAPTGTCTPAVDVIERDGAFEVVVDLPGVTARDVRVLIKGGTLLLAGEKGPCDLPDRASATFHLVERGFGRFARAIPLAGATDASRATARFEDGELRIVIPKIVERRGREIVVPIEEGSR